MGQCSVLLVGEGGCSSLTWHRCPAGKGGILEVGLQGHREQVFRVCHIHIWHQSPDSGKGHAWGGDVGLRDTLGLCSVLMEPFPLQTLRPSESGM